MHLEQLPVHEAREYPGSILCENEDDVIYFGHSVQNIYENKKFSM